ncbi:MAG: prepilin-type N-terminal cleavage/methylation domain-containing protein, partial [Xanthomonadales bacterium]|nr:prepilin-type N-terminal cleavage/methylation domain-containing protein [Xanthomonadales bacterium]
MPTPPVILHRRAPGRPRGMSLVEVMVVLVIIGVVGTLAVLRWRTDDPAQALRDVAEDFSRLLEYQCESVLLDARDRGVQVSREGFAPATRDGAGLAASGAMQPWPGDASVSLSVDGISTTADDGTGLRCSPEGAWPPFELRLSA